MKNLKKKLPVISMAVLLGIALCFLFWLHYNALKNARNSSSWQNHTYEVINSNNELLLILLDAETSQRGFIITGDRSFLKPFLESQGKVSIELTKLRQLVKDNTAELVRVDTLAKLCNLRFQFLQQGIVFAQQHKNDEATQLVKNGAGNEVMNQVKSVINSFNNEEKDLLKKRNIAAARAINFSYKSLIIGQAIILSIFIWIFISLIQQVKKRKKAYSQLFISREWFSKTLLSIGEGVIITDARGIITFINKIAENLTGRSSGEVKGKSIDFACYIINEHSRLPIENPVNTALKENRTIHTNGNLMITKENKFHYIDCSAAPINNDEGVIIGAILSFRDVTERYNTGKKLMQSEKLLKDITDTTNSLIYIKDVNGKYLMLNQQKQKLFNISAQEVIGKTPYEFFLNDIAAQFMEADDEVIKKLKLVEFEQAIKQADGNARIYCTTKFPLFNSEEKAYAVATISTDITESKKNEELQKKLEVQDVILKGELKYNTLTENMPNIFFSFDHSMKYVHWNKACEKLTGIAAEQAIGKNISEVFPEFNNPIMQASYLHLQQTGSIKSFTTEFTFGENKHIYLVNIYPSEQGTSVVMTDITDQKKSEQATLELVKRLQIKNKDFSQVAYMVSHNLRAPIAKIEGLLAYFEEDPKEIIFDSSLIEHIKKEVSNLDNVITDMFTIISARDSGAHIKEQIFFEDKLKLIKQVLENEIIKSNATITADFNKAKSVVTIQSYLYSIMYNLISNAIKYRSPIKPLNIHLKTEENEKFICLSISDNGLGIDIEKNKEKIFGLYKRLHNVDVPGKGIGLHLVKTQAESLGGKVEVESKPNEGTTFKVFISKS